MIEVEEMVFTKRGYTYMEVWETAFGILCFGLLALNIGYCIFDNE